MLRQLIIKVLRRNEFESILLRELFMKWHGITVGLYSYGCFDHKRIPNGTTIGRYCSFSSTCHIFSRDHGVRYLSLHPYLYNASLGMVAEDTIQHTNCVIEDDVWIGHNATITSGVSRIGRGAIIAAGSTVTRNVPRYAIVAGSPARVIKIRFKPQVIKEIEETQWWMMEKTELAELIKRNPSLVFTPVAYYDQED